MTIPEIATRLVELCAKGEFETAQKELYSPDAVSLEPYATPDFAKETKGLDAILKKGERFSRMTEVLHNVTISHPLFTGNTFAFILTMDITMKGKPRVSMGELCVYQVKEGKIIAEQFFM